MHQNQIYKSWVAFLQGFFPINPSGRVKQPHGIDPIIQSYHLLPKEERTPNTRPDGLIGKNPAEMLPNS